MNVPDRANEYMPVYASYDQMTCANKQLIHLPEFSITLQPKFPFIFEFTQQYSRFRPDSSQFGLTEKPQLCPIFNSY